MEIILAVKKRLESELTHITKRPKLDIFFLTKDETPFSSLNTQLKEHCLNVISENNITVISNFLASKIDTNCVLNHDGDPFYLDLGVIATGPSPQPWTKISGLSLCENGYVRVKDNLTCEQFGNIFVSGDAASLTKHPDLPKSGLTTCPTRSSFSQKYTKKIE